LFLKYVPSFVELFELCVPLFDDPVDEFSFGVVAVVPLLVVPPVAVPPVDVVVSFDVKVVFAGKFIVNVIFLLERR
jgi:hypothetical protein